MFDADSDDLLATVLDAVIVVGTIAIVVMTILYFTEPSAPELPPLSHEESIQVQKLFEEPEKKPDPMRQHINKLSEADLEEQRIRREHVRVRCTSACRTIAKLGSADAVPAADDVPSLTIALMNMQSIAEENERDGSLGVIASTEMCNCMLAADALKALDALRQHADPTVAASATAVFEHVIPRIWSF